MVIALGARGRCMWLDRGRRRFVVSNGTSWYLDGLIMDIYIYVSAGMIRASPAECGPRISSVLAVEVGCGCGYCVGAGRFGAVERGRGAGGGLRPY